MGEPGGVKKRYRRVSLFQKFAISFALLAVMTGALVWAARSAVDLAARSVRETISLHINQLNRVNHLLSTANQIRRLETDLSRHTDIFVIAGECDETLLAADRLERELGDFLDEITTVPGKSRTYLVQGWESYRDGLHRVVGAARENRLEAASALSVAETWPRFAVFIDQLEKVSTEIDAHAQADKEATLEMILAREMLFYWLTGGGLVLFLLFGVIFWRSVVDRVRELHRAAASLAAGGEFSAGRALWGDDEIHDLADILVQMAQAVKTREQGLKEAHDQLGERVEERTRELARTNQKLLAEAEERLHAEKHAREAEAKYRRLFEATTEGVILADEEFRLVAFNPAAAALHGLKPASLGQRTLRDLLNAESWEVLGEIRRTLAADNLWRSEVSAQHSSGTRFPAELKATSFTVGEERYYLIYVTDITAEKNLKRERREMQERLARSEKMEALGILAGGVAHDLNNVLSPVVAYPDLILGDANLSPNNRKMVGRIQTGALKASGIVQDLLSLARRGVTVRAPVDINELVREYATAFEPSPARTVRGITLNTRLDPKLATILGSQVHLYKIIMNLVQNAVEASPDGAIVSVVTRNETVPEGNPALKPGDYAVLVVEDSGTGIEPEHLSHIFEPFYSRKTMGQSGTGLGMAVVWGAVKDHDGTIEVDSRVGEGTVFTLHFPAAGVAREKEVSEDLIAMLAGRGERVLVVDDMESQRELMMSMLTRLGYSPYSIESGEKALEWLKENRVDLLVLDMLMAPGIDGLDTFRGAIKIQPGVKAIISSGFSESVRVKLALELGAGSYLKKPFTLETLAKSVRQELDRKAEAQA